MDKPKLKNNKIYKPSFWKRSGKKFLLGAIGVGMTLLTAFTFVGCVNNNNNNNQNPPDKDPPSVVVDPETSISLEDFVKSYKDKANDFIVDVVEPEIVNKDKVLSRKFYISANENAELNHLDLVYTLSHDDTTRSVEIANVDLDKPIDLDDIVSGKNLKPVDFKFDLKSVFDFDAKENFLKIDLANALYSSAEVESPVKLFSEKLSKLDNSRSFNIYKESENNISVLEVKSNVQDSTDENLLLNLANPAQVSVDGTFSFDFKGANTLNESYSLENFEETENPGPGPEITDPQEPEKEEITDAEVVESLNQYCADGVIKRALAGIKVDKNNISNENWYITSDADGNITKAEITFNYKRDNETSMYAIGTVTFESPVSKEDLKNGNFSNATYKAQYTLTYNIENQITRQALTNAILSVCTDQLTEGSTRILVDVGPNVDDVLGMETHEFKVVEITENGIQEYSIRVKESNSGSGYIANLQNASNFRIVSQKSYTIEGSVLEQKQIKNTNLQYDFSFDSEDLLEY